MRKAILLLAMVGLMAGPLAGCLSFLRNDEPVQAVDENQKKAEEILGDQGLEQLQDLASATPKNYTFPGQQLLPRQTIFVNGSVGAESTLSYEGNQDQGGTAYNAIVQTTDVSKYVPAGQPVEIFIKLRWNAKEMNSVDYDIYVDLPGNKTAYYPAKSEDMNWNVPTKTLTVNTVGVAGAPHLIGVQAASGKTAGPVEYTMQIEFNYVRDVVTPAVPYAFQVPANASGLIFESVKASGDEHVRSEFIVIGPDDNLVGFVEFNDIAIPTESVFVPTSGPGEYVFWAYYMQGGFMSVRADAPLENLQARALKTAETSVVVDSAPSPGMVGRDWGFNSAVGGGAVVTPMTGQKEATFSLDGTHPLGVKAFVKGQGTLGTQVKISSSKGAVHELTRIARYDDDRGSIGYTSDHGMNNQLFNVNIVKGAYKVEYVNNGPAEVGYTVLTYQR